MMPTFVLLLVMMGYREPAMVAVPGFPTLDQCRAAGRGYAEEMNPEAWRRQSKYFQCVLGPQH